jgi:tripartite-type tricarboxylate transporter receptor subunit TctC
MRFRSQRRAALRPLAWMAAATAIGSARPAAAGGAGGAGIKSRPQEGDALPVLADFPTRPVEFLVAYPAGGGMDVTARLLARYFEKHTGRNAIVVNKPGAAGVVGESYMATQAGADGYTVGIMASNFWSNSHLKAEGKWSYQSTEPISFLNYDPLAWLVAVDGPFGALDLPKLLEQARSKPASISVAASSSTATAFLLEQVEAAARVRFVPVQYQGGRQALTDLMGGHIHVSYGYFAEYRSLLETGKLRAIGVSSLRRLDNLKGTPTFNEVLGTSDILWDAFRFAVVPKGTPPERKRWLESVFQRMLADPDLVDEFAKLGATVDPQLNTADKVAREVTRRAELERNYLVKTGRLK